MVVRSTGSGAATASAVLKAAMSQIGVKYTWGGESPGKDFDCSGFTQWCYSTVGIDLPRTSEAQYAAVPQISAAQAQPGDLVFAYFGEQGQAGPGHVGIYVGKGRYIDAPHTGAFIGISPVPAGATYGRVPGLTMDASSDVATQAGQIASSSTGGPGCAGKGKIFGVLGLSVSFCQGKAVVGGLTVGIGSGVALMGAIIITAWGLGNTRAGGAAMKVAKVAVLK